MLSLDNANHSRFSSGETGQHTWLDWFTRHRRAGLFVAGGLCAVGVCIALSNPTASPSEHSESSEPSGVSGVITETSAPLNTHDSLTLEPSTPVESHGIGDEADRDPRAVVVDLALSGHLDGIPTNIQDVTAEVVSRNGDIVLVDLVAFVNSTPSSFSVVLVRSSNTWIVRELYPSASSDEPISTS